MKKEGLYYCIDCNEVYEYANKDRQCPLDIHKKKIDITPKQYVDWIIQGKPKLEIKKNE